MNWKKHKIIILPIDKIEGKMHSSMTAKEKGKLFNYNNPKYSYDKATFQYFYILSDEEIKEGDWAIYNGKVAQINNPEAVKLANTKGHRVNELSKKIIATTDTSLGLPQIPQSFIEYYMSEYNEGNQIGKVMIEWESDLDAYYRNGVGGPIMKVKNNTISIKPIKGTFTREDIIHAFTSGHNKAKMGMTHSDALLQYKEEQNL